MPVYVLQEGCSNTFKIGLTAAGNFDRRRQQLNTGSSEGLRTFQVIDVEPAGAAESFFHGLLAHRRIAGHRGTEFFQMQSEEHMRVFLEHAVSLFERSMAAHVGMDLLEQALSTREVRVPEEEDYALFDALCEHRRRLRELEDEAVILKAEVMILEARLKARIGTGSGIAGLVSWESGAPLRRFCLPSFIQGEPKIYQVVLGRFQMLDHKAWKSREPALYREVTARHPQLDTAAWRSRDGELYQRMRGLYFTTKVSRRFQLTGF